MTGTLDTTDIGNSKDAATGVPVYSVYGDTDAKRRPPLDVVKDLDAVVYRRSGCRRALLHLRDHARIFSGGGGEGGNRGVVLDRPNPITGTYRAGAGVASPGSESFVNYFPVPVRHGMTVGELAKMFNAERHINAQADGDRRWKAGCAATGTTPPDWLWINPSPNLRSLTEATLVSRSGGDRGHECFGGTRDRHAV